MEMLSSPNDIVLDPMVGKGDFIEVAGDLNRKAIGIERL